MCGMCSQLLTPQTVISSYQSFKMYFKTSSQPWMKKLLLRINVQDYMHITLSQWSPLKITFHNAQTNSDICSQNRIVTDLRVAAERLVELPGPAVADAEAAEGGGLESPVAQLLGEYSVLSWDFTAPISTLEPIMNKQWRVPCSKARQYDSRTFI